MAAHSRLLPVTVLTGFLGSGKTTLLKRLLAAPTLEETAVLVNEFGDVGLDHHLVDHVAESTLVLENGCVCCAVRDDLVGAIKDLLSKKAQKQCPDFRRIVIETSGLADPAPIAYTLLTDPVIRHHVRLGNIVTLVDARNGQAQLAAYEECQKQVALADCIIVSKSDLTTPDETAPLLATLHQRNPAAALYDVAELPNAVETLLLRDIYETAGREAAAARWHAVSDTDHHHSTGIQAFSIAVDQPMDWTAFGLWMSLLVHSHGDRILRIKGLLDVAGIKAPVLINAAQHIVHPPAHLPAWPDEARGSKIVFIVDGVEPATVKQSLQAFTGVA